MPWERPLAEWLVPDVPLRDMAVGPSRHLVKFVECDGALWALKELPPRIAVREYAALGRIEELHLNAVRPAGVVQQPDFDTAILLTRYLEGSWQYRRLFLRLPPDAPKQRSRLLDGMASLLVELHRRGVFWGTARWPTRSSRATARCCRPRWSTPRPVRSTRTCPMVSASSTST